MYELLAQVNASVPEGVWLTKISYGAGEEGVEENTAIDELLIEGKSINDQNIVKFIANLASKSHVTQASLLSMTLPQAEESDETGRRKVVAKSFNLRCRLGGIQEVLLPSESTNKNKGGDS